MEVLCPRDSKLEEFKAEKRALRESTENRELKMEKMKALKQKYALEDLRTKAKTAHLNCMSEKASQFGPLLVAKRLLKGYCQIPNRNIGPSRKGPNSGKMSYKTDWGKGQAKDRGKRAKDRLKRGAGYAKGKTKGHWAKMKQQRRAHIEQALLSPGCQTASK